MGIRETHPCTEGSYSEVENTNIYQFGKSLWGYVNKGMKPALESQERSLLREQWLLRPKGWMGV